MVAILSWSLCGGLRGFSRYSLSSRWLSWQAHSFSPFGMIRDMRYTAPNNCSLMRLILVDKGKEFCDVLRWQFRLHPEVEIVCGRFEDLHAFDCVVTAGNSFGLMDAGM